MDLKHLADVSSYLLMEDSADSEADFVQSRVPAMYGGDGYDDDDDAESCSCDSSEVLASHADDCDNRESRDQWNALSQKSSLVWEPDRDDGNASIDADEEEESWVDSGGRTRGGDLRKEDMEAMEDKVFWETCMAVGYP